VRRNKLIATTGIAAFALAFWLQPGTDGAWPTATVGAVTEGLPYPDSEGAVGCELDLDDHPTRDEVIAVLGDPVDVDHDAGESNLDGSEWLPATTRLEWPGGNIVTFDADTDRATAWVMDHPAIC
jgi:hypothetical protein